MTEEEKKEEIKEAPAATTPAATGGRDDNVVFVGKKGAMGYVLAVVTQFNNGAKEVSVKARGKLISRAVDVAEITRRRFMEKLKVSNISIDTENLVEQETSRTRAVSTIEITLSMT